MKKLEEKRVKDRRDEERKLKLEEDAKEAIIKKAQQEERIKKPLERK